MQNPAPQTGPATEPRTGPAKNYITSVIRILNYDDYQPNGTTDDTTDRATDETTNQTTDRANHGPVTGQRRAQRKKVKKVNKREEATLDDFDALCGEDRFALLRRPEIRGKVEFWLNCRTQRNKPLTVNAVTRDMLNMVRVLKAGGTAELIGEWMATAEYNHWQGWFFPESFEKWKGSGAKSVGRTTYKPLEERDDNE